MVTLFNLGVKKKYNRRLFDPRLFYEKCLLNLRGFFLERVWKENKLLIVMLLNKPLDYLFIMSNVNYSVEQRLGFEYCPGVLIQQTLM